MAQRAPDVGSVDDVQIFDAVKGSQGRPRGALGGAQVAISPNCEIELLRAPARGERRLLPDPMADCIILVLHGECVANAPSGTHLLQSNQGVLVTAGGSGTFTSTSDEELVLLSMSTGSAAERPGYIPNRPSGVFIRVPAAELEARGIGRHLYVFAMDHRTIGVGVNFTEEWNRGSLLRMNCEYERSGVDILVNLPERMARWYQVRGLTDADYRISPDNQTRVRVDLGPLVAREASGATERAAG
ncbi:MAG: hypothetical protein GEU73_16100 [Chloroflexi bacterium]|nr:hypothetical protein [Chloroflexota bacterium]